MKKFISAFAVALITMAASASAFGAEKMKTMDKGMSMEPTTEMRQKMATVHENMATCLRSDKPIADCKKEMMKACEDSMGKECKMMHEMHGMKGHDMKHHEMKGDEKSDE
jgi:long-subunit fatty acid transport protein